MTALMLAPPHIMRLPRASRASMLNVARSPATALVEPVPVILHPGNETCAAAACTEYGHPTMTSPFNAATSECAPTSGHTTTAWYRALSLVRRSGTMVDKPDGVMSRRHTASWPLTSSPPIS